MKQQLTAAQDQVAQQKLFYKDMQSMYLSSKLDLQHENSQLSSQLEQMKNNLTAFFNLLGDKTRQAISAIREFAYDGCFTRFTFQQASTVNNYLLACSNRKIGANTLILLSRPFITEQGYEKSKPEIHNVANDFGWYVRVEQQRIAEEERQKVEVEQRKLQEMQADKQAQERARQQELERQKTKRIPHRRTTIVQDRPTCGFHR